MAQPQDHKAMEHITITGCVQREDEYRRANNLGKGGAVGTGVGADNEYVLVNVSMTGAVTGTAGTSGTAPAAPGAAATAAAPGLAYELTGANESQVGAFVGKRVEIVGMLKKAEVGAGGAATGGVTAGAPPAGTDVVSKDLRLRELEVMSVKETTGTCTPADK